MSKYVKVDGPLGKKLLCYSPDIGEHVTLVSSLAHNDKVGASFKVKAKGDNAGTETYELVSDAGKVVAVLGQVAEQISSEQLKTLRSLAKGLDHSELREVRVSSLAALPASRYNEIHGYLKAQAA